MMTIDDIQALVPIDTIQIQGLRTHSKASEQYVDVIFLYPQENRSWEGSIPYFYRRAGLFLTTPQDIAELIIKAYSALTLEKSTQWIQREKKLWNTEYAGKETTKGFFIKLLNLKWNCVDTDLPKNRNWARRIQDIKEMGYFIATNTRKYNPKLNKNTTQLILVPLEKAQKTGYETFSAKLRKRIIKVLGNYDAYEGKVKPAHMLLPDHKFPEISWDSTTPQENPDDMTDDEIRDKFQLLDNQRNLEKREACRKVFETGDLGTIFGIEFYLNEDGKWPKDIPKVGSKSIDGWKLCPWYDIEAWRKKLNKKLSKISN